MNGTTFDALAATGTLRDAGFGDRQAEAVAGVVRHAVDADRGALATKADIAALRADHAALRADTRADIAALRADTRADLDALRADTRADIASVRADLDNLESRMQATLYRALWMQTGAIIGTIVATAGVVVAAIELL